MPTTHIRDAACRHCGAVNIGESWWGLNAAEVMTERRDFACGAMSIWHRADETAERPGALATRESVGCPGNPVRVEALRRGQAVLEELRNLISAHVLDLPENIRLNLLGSINMAARDLDRCQ